MRWGLSPSVSLPVDLAGRGGVSKTDVWVENQKQKALGWNLLRLNDMLTDNDWYVHSSRRAF